MMANRIVRIQDPDDPRISGYRNIRDRDLLRDSGQFMAEGTVLLSMLRDAHRAGTGFVAQSVLLLENRLSGLEEILSGLPDDVPVYVAAKSVLDMIAGFDLHRGVLALGKRLIEPDLASLIKTNGKNSLIVTACGISNHDNIGAIFRNAAAFGADAVLLDETSCDPLYRKALRVSVGSILRTPYSRKGSVVDIMSSLINAGYELWGLAPAGGEDIREIQPGPRVALMTGSEGPGLPQQVLDAIATARIPQVPGLDSLNAGTATGIALFHIASKLRRL